MTIAKLARKTMLLIIAACVFSLMTPYYASIAHATEAQEAAMRTDIGTALAMTPEDDDVLYAQASANATTVTLNGFKYDQAEARTMLDLVNKFRTSSSWQWNSTNTQKVSVAAMPPVTIDAKLEQAAMQRAAECAIRYSHTRPDDSSCASVYGEVGYTWTTYGENIALGFENVQEMFDGWKEENEKYDGQGHRRNMQNRDFNTIGIACAEVNGVKFWAMELGRTTSASTPGVAFNGTRSVTMNILNDKITRSGLKVSQDSILLLVGETATLPTVSATCNVKTEDAGAGNYWNFSKATFSEAVTPSWSMANSNIASIANGSVRGALPGTTTLNATANGQTAKATVTVKEDKPEVMYRCYNPNSGEHFYTASAAERDNLKKAGWTYEGEGWKAPAKSSTPVYRLYSGTDHHYTTNAGERDNLVKVGWKYEGIGWYSDDNKGVPLHRVFNPNVNPQAARNNSGSHHYTTSAGEYNQLCRIGWNGEGVGWYGCK